MTLDKLAFVKGLEGPDKFSRPQAEALSEPFDQAIRDSVATKEDLLRLETALRGDMATLQARLTGAMSTLRVRLTGDMASLRADVHREMAGNKVWTLATLAAVLAAAFSVIVTLLRH